MAVTTAKTSFTICCCHLPGVLGLLEPRLAQQYALDVEVGDPVDVEASSLSICNTARTCSTSVASAAAVVAATTAASRPYWTKGTGEAGAAGPAPPACATPAEGGPGSADAGGDTGVAGCGGSLAPLRVEAGGATTGASS